MAKIEGDPFSKRRNRANFAESPPVIAQLRALTKALPPEILTRARFKKGARLQILMVSSSPCPKSRCFGPPLAPDDPLFVVAPAGPVGNERLQRSLKQLARDLRSVEEPRPEAGSATKRAGETPNSLEEQSGRASSGPPPSSPPSFPSASKAQRAPAQDLPFEIAPQVALRRGYFAGDDQERSQALLTALRDPQSRTIWPARGGYGLTRILSRLDTLGPSFPGEAPRIIGFSDITALLCWAYRRFGLASIHGPVLAQYAEIHPLDRQRALDMLRGEIPAPLEAETGPALFGGRVEGPLITANLELLRTLLGTPHFPPLDGHILAVEDVGERPYRLDRCLTQLRQSGALRKIRGIALGSFEKCDPPQDDQPTAEEVLIERLQELGVPLLGGFPFGHQKQRNAALPFGTRVRLDVDQGVLEMLEPVFRPKSGA